MNKLLYSMFAVLLIGTSHASSTIHCNCGLTEFVESFLDTSNIQEQESIKIKKLTDEEIRVVGVQLCIDIYDFSNNGFKAEQFENTILDALEVPRSTNRKQKNQIISNFLNINKQKLICPKSTDKSGSRDKHVYKLAVLQGVIDLFDEILLDDEEYEIDFNAYEIVDGKKETLVDYIEKYIIKFPDEELELLLDDIIEMGGKRGSEL